MDSMGIKNATVHDVIAARHFVDRIVAQKDELGISNSAIGRHCGRGAYEDPGCVVRSAIKYGGKGTLTAVVRLGSALWVSSDFRSDPPSPVLVQTDGLEEVISGRWCGQELDPIDADMGFRQKLVTEITEWHLGEIDDMFRYIVAGMSSRQLAEKIGCSKGPADLIRGIGGKSLRYSRVHRLTYVARTLGYKFSV